MAQRELTSDRDAKTGRTRKKTDACGPRNHVGRVVVPSIKTGQFTRSEIKKAIREVASERLAGCHSG